MIIELTDMPAGVTGFEATGKLRAEDYRDVLLWAEYTHRGRVGERVAAPGHALTVLAVRATRHDALRQVGDEEGWLFVDNLTALRAYPGRDRLYNDFDYHLLPTASTIIGKMQAAVLLRYLRRHRMPPGPPAHMTGQGP